MVSNTIGTIPVIVLNWNGLEDTTECWKAMKAQTWHNFHLYLVDNGSEGSEVAQLSPQFDNEAQVQLILNKENQGFTEGNNQVLRSEILQNPDYEFVVLLNNDAIPHPEWLHQLLDCAVEEEADMVSSKMVNYHDHSRLDNVGHKMLNTLEVLPIGSEKSPEDYDEVFEHMGPCGGAALYSVKMLREIGIFDPHFTNGYEDVELGLRGVLSGYKAVFAPRAVVYHKISRSVNKLRDLHYTVNIQRNIYYVMGKLIPAGTLLICFPFVVLRFVLAFLINLLTFRWKYLKIQSIAAYKTMTKDLSGILKARKAFAPQRKISSLALLGKTEFFLRHDIMRFNKYIIRKEKMVFEKY